jgi:hypothetical protein
VRCRRRRLKNRKPWCCTRVHAPPPLSGSSRSWCEAPCAVVDATSTSASPSGRRPRAHHPSAPADMVLKRDRWWGQFGELCRLSQRLVDWHASRLYRRDTANRQRLDTLVNETDHMLLLGWWKERKGLGRLCRTPRPSPGGATQTDRPLPRLLSAVTGHPNLPAPPNLTARAKRCPPSPNNKLAA